MVCAIGLTRVSRQWHGVGLVCLMSVLAVLACTSNDTLLIHLTATPLPIPTPTAVSAATRFKIGDKPVFVAAASPQRLLQSPDVNDRSGGTDLCFTSTQVTISDVAIGKDHIVYYRVKCASANGWTLEGNLTLLKPGSSATLKTDSFLTNDPGPDDPDNRAANEVCKAAVTIGVLDLAMTPRDNIIYAQVQCGAAVGWLPGSALQAVEAP